MCALCERSCERVFLNDFMLVILLRAHAHLYFKLFYKNNIIYIEAHCSVRRKIQNSFQK